MATTQNSSSLFQEFISDINSPSFLEEEDLHRRRHIIHKLRSLLKPQCLEGFQAILNSKSFQTLDDINRIDVMIVGLYPIPESQRLEGLQAILNSDGFLTLDDASHASVTVGWLNALPSTIKEIVLFQDPKNQNLTLVCPIGTVNPEYSIALRFNGASGQIGMVGGCQRLWTEKTSDLVKRYKDREKTRPDQCAKIAAVFGAVVQMRIVPEETKKGMLEAIRVLNREGTVSNDFKVPSVMFYGFE